MGMDADSTPEWITAALQHARFVDITWLEPSATGFYQPIVTAHVRA